MVVQPGLCQTWSEMFSDAKMRPKGQNFLSIPLTNETFEKLAIQMSELNKISKFLKFRSLKLIILSFPTNLATCFILGQTQK